jgi:hypothetical protein
MGRFHYDKKGYPRWNNNNRLVHRDVASKMVGGSISPDKVVHHIDGNKANFRRSNLRVMDRSSHSRLEARKRRY